MAESRGSVGSSETEGSLLRRRRQACGWSLPTLAQDLCIRLRYLEAIEDGRFGDLPGPAYAAGFVRAYAAYLGLDSAALVRRFKREAGKHTPPQALNFRLPVADSGVPPGAMILVGALIVGITYGVWYVDSLSGSHLVRQVSPVPERLSRSVLDDAPEPAVARLVRAGREASAGGRGQQAGGAAADKNQLQESATTRQPGRTDGAELATAQPPAPAGSGGGRGLPVQTEGDAAGARPSMTVTLRPSPETEPPPSPPPAAAAGPFDPGRIGPDASGTVARVILRARAECWIEIKDDVTGKLIFARLLRPGESYAVPDRPGLKLLAGNAGGIDVLVDSIPMGALGRDGSVVRNVFLEPDRLRGPGLPVRREG